MKIFDFNIHPKINLSSHDSILVDKAVNHEMLATPDDLIKSISHFNTEHLNGINLMLFSQYFVENQYEFELFVQKSNSILNKKLELIEYTVLVDPDINNAEKFFTLLNKLKIKLIKFHSYHQNITNEKINKCVELSILAERFNIGICIDASYGTRRLYCCDNLKLASEILLRISNVPVIILHMGGLRALEAALIIEDSPNAYLELSFTPKYYEGLSFYNSLLDVMSIIGSDRVLHASDFPYISIEDSISTTNKLLKLSALNSDLIENVFWNNSELIFKSLTI